MLPPEFESIPARLCALYRTFLLQDATGTAVPELLTAEERVVAFVHALGLALLHVFVQVRLLQAKAGRRPCSCGVTPTIHRTTRWTRQTPFGPLVIEDPYAYCRTCHDSERPLHGLLGTDRETWSLIVQEAAVDLVADESAGKAVAKLARHHPGVEMDRTAALRLMHEHGKRARVFINGKLAAARKLAELPWGLCGEGAEELEVQWDGGMIPVATLEPIEPPKGQKPELTPVRGLPKRRKAWRWEEAKLGLAQKPGEVDRLYSLRPTSDLDESFDDLFALACMKGWTEQTQVRGIADGARHIRARMTDLFDVGDFRFILDRPHCKGHLSDAGTALEVERELEAEVTVQGWATTALAKLELGDAAEVVAELQQAWEESGPDPKSRNDALRREAGYFERNADAVVYADYRARGWSTASGEAESAHGHVVQARLKIAGAWWHPDHVDDILALRMLKANHWWDEYWEEQRRAWRRRAETFAEARADRAA